MPPRFFSDEIRNHICAVCQSHFKDCSGVSKYCPACRAAARAAVVAKRTAKLATSGVTRTYTFNAARRSPKSRTRYTPL